MTNWRKAFRGIYAAVILIVIGTVAFFNAGSATGYDKFRTTEVFRLVAAGMCYGVAMIIVILYFWRDRSD